MLRGNPKDIHKHSYVIPKKVFNSTIQCGITWYLRPDIYDT